MSGAAPAFVDAVLAARGIALSEAQRDLLARYGELLLHWNRRINLVGARDAETLWSRHLLDCLMLETVPRGPGLRRWLDVGSGAGLPGLVLAIVHPELHLTAVESVARKATFLGEAARQLGLSNVHCLRQDVHRLAAEAGFVPFDALVARAYGPLAALLELGRSLLRPGGEVWAMKGRRWRAEADALPAALRAAYPEPPAVHAYSLAPTQAPRSADDAVVLVYRRPPEPPTAA